MSTDKKNIVVTSHNQTGGVTAHTVNIGSQNRQMTDHLGEQLKHEIPIAARVSVVSVLDGEAFSFAIQVFQWLKSNGYSKIVGVDQVVYSQPVIGQSIKKISETEFEILIGNKP